MNDLKKTIQKFGYDSVEDFAKEHAVLLILSKIEEYQNKVNYYEKKYGMDFRGFEKKLSLIENQENFEKEDDYMDWRFCVESLIRYKNELRDLNN